MKKKEIKERNINDNNKFSKYLLFLPFIIPILLFVGKFRYDNDFWFTINQGRYVIEHGLPSTVISTIHSGLSFLYQSSGTGVLFYLIYRYLGNYGMIFLMIITLELIVYFYYKLCMLVSNNNYKSIIITTLFLLIFGLYTFPRPHMFTVLNLILIIYSLEKYIRSDNKKDLIPIPFLFFLQVYMHGIYYVPLLVIICPYLLNSFKYKFKFLNEGPVNYHKKPLFITYLISILVGFINPYTYKIFTYGFTSYGSSVMKENINELGSINFNDFFGKICIITIIVSFIIFIANIKKKKIPLRYYLLILGTTILALDAYKSFYIFIVCTFFGIAYIFRIDEIRKTKKKEIVIASIIVLILGIILIPKIKITDPPQKASADYLIENKKIDNPRLYTSFYNGSYYEYAGFNCYIDPRAELFLKSNNKKENILEEYFDMQNGKTAANKFIDKYNFDYIVVYNDDTLYNYLNNIKEHNYTKIYDVDNYQIWEINDIKKD